MIQRVVVSTLLLAIAGSLVSSSTARASSKSQLSVTIDGLKSQRGQVCLSLFDNSRGFPASSNRAVQSRCLKASSQSLTVTFQNLNVGSYAIAVIHDVNNDGTLNRNAFGIPTEGFGFSQNPKIRTGPPKFGDSAVLVVGPNTNVEIQLQYLLGG